jgi:hypothetical protein
MVGLVEDYDYWGIVIFLNCEFDHIEFTLEVLV